METISTRIHRELGLPAGPLDFALIERAVEAKLGEFEDLDWKGVLPEKGEVNIEEFAKDVAAMANTRGGLLVFGVKETRGTGKAESIKPVDISETAQGRFRSLVGSRIHPFIAGLRILALPSPNSDDGEGVLVVVVPRSADAPHAFGNDKLGIPYRFESKTNWMRERELEAAYAERFHRRTADQARLIEILDGVTGRVDLTTGAWLVAASAPRVAYPGTLPRITLAQARQILTDALSRTNAIASPQISERQTLIRDLDNAGLNPRKGLRRWVAHTAQSLGPDSLSDFVYVEVHDDGSVGFAAKTEGWFKPVYDDRYQVPIGLAESFVIDAVALTVTTARNLGLDGQSGIAVDLRRNDQSRPVAMLDAERRGGFTLHEFGQPSWSRSVLKFETVLGEVQHDGDDDALRRAAATISRDVLNQFGFDYSLVLKDVDF